MQGSLYYFVIIVSILVIPLFLKLSVANANELHQHTLYEQQAIETAFEHFVRTKQWQRADELFQTSIVTPYYSPRFYELAVVLLVHQNQQDEARKLLGLARDLYPANLSFMASHALLLAQTGHCDRAAKIWDHYEAASPFPISKRQADGFTHYCGIAPQYRQSLSSRMEKISRGNRPPGSDEVTAIKGSYLYDLCSLLPDLCPHDLQFSLGSKTSRKLSVTAQYNAQSIKRYNWRHSAEVGFQLSHELVGYHGYEGQLYAHWHYRLSSNKHLGVGTGVTKSYLPTFEDDSAISTRSTFASLSYDEQFSRNWRTHILYRHSAHDITRTDLNETSHSTQNSYSLYYRPSPAIELGATIIADTAKPGAVDDKGPSSRQGYDLSLSYYNSAEFSLSFHYIRAKTKYEKTLPYLTAPHHLGEERYHLRLAKNGKQPLNITPFLDIHKQDYSSANPSQDGSHTAISIGLSYQL